MTQYTANANIVINTPAAKVWQALTTPEQIKQYLFGAQVESNWQVGSPIVYRGEWEGKPYEDKGTILKLVPGQLLQATYFSPLSGLEDVPENYQRVTYALTESGGKTTLAITQENNKDQASADSSAQNWTRVLENLKKLLEPS